MSVSVSRAHFVLSVVLSIDVCQPREIVHARFFSAHVIRTIIFEDEGKPATFQNIIGARHTAQTEQ